LHYRSIQNRFLKPQFGFKIPLNSINRQVQDRQFTDYPLSEIVTPSWRAESGATWQLISPIHSSKDIDLDYVEAGHLAAFGDLFDYVREDEYLLNGRRYWTCIYLCPDPNCDCHEARIVFFDDADDSGAGVGWVYLDISGPVGIHIMEISAERGAPEALIKELWGLFECRHDTGSFLRRREAQCKIVGETLWEPASKPVHATPQPGRNDACPCGSGRKFKKCCLNKNIGSPETGDPSVN
jgi:hypothetical protein